ncbi:MAG: hypothetical protein AAF938_03425 [Myxococcota bacterium]
MTFGPNAFRLALLVVLMRPSWVFAQPAAPQVNFESAAFSDVRVQRAVRRCVDRFERVVSAAAPARLQQVESAERICARVERLPPSAERDAILAHLAALRAWANAEAASANAASDARRGLNGQLARLPIHINSSWASEDDSARIDGEIRALDGAVTAVLPALANADRSALTSLTTLHAHFASDASQCAQERARIAAALRDHGVPDALHARAAVMAARLRVGARLFPEDAAIVQAAADAQTFLASLGGRDGAAATREAAQAERARAVSFPAAATRDRTVEQQARTAFEDQGWNETVLRLALLEPAWWNDREAGRVVSRRRRVAIGVRLADGSCRVYDFTVQQPRTTSGWGGVRRRAHSSTPIACANLGSAR